MIGAPAGPVNPASRARIAAMCPSTSPASSPASPSPGPDLPAALRAYADRHDLLPAGSRVVVAVSGGADSVALLDLLCALAPERDVALRVAHLDHGLRPASVEDAAFVATLAEARRLPASIDARDVRAWAARRGKGIEEAARILRYRFLADTALAWGAERVATAQHADDQAETVLMNVLRGAGLEGLRGMRPSARWPYDEPPGARELRLVRPLLPQSRVALRAWLARRGLEHREDASNDDRARLRNRLRHEIIPELETVNPRLREAMLRLSASAAADLAYLEAETEALWAAHGGLDAEGRARIDLAGWDALPLAMRRRLLRRAVAALGGDLRALGLDHADALLDALEGLDLEGEPNAGAAARSLPGALQARVEDGALLIGTDRSVLPPARLGREPIPLTLPGRTALPGGWAIAAERRPRRPGDRLPPRDPWTVRIDADAPRDALAVRARRPGDRIRPLGMAGRSRSLQDLFVDAKVPAAERDGWPLLVAGERVLWVPGHRIDERARIHEGTREVYEIRAVPPTRLR